MDKFWAECRLDQRQGQVSCDWRNDGHVTTITNSDWPGPHRQHRPRQPRPAAARTEDLCGEVGIHRAEAAGWPQPQERWRNLSSKCTRLTFSQKYSEDKQNRKESILILTSDAVTNRCTNYKSFYLFYSEHKKVASTVKCLGALSLLMLHKLYNCCCKVTSCSLSRETFWFCNLIFSFSSYNFELLLTLL